MGIENLNCFFNPKTIAVIGASERKGSLGGLIFNNLTGNYNGEIYPVNAFRQSIQKKKAYPSISTIPVKVDLAVIATPAHTVPQIVEECARGGVGGIIIVSAGFSADNSIGQELTQQIIERSKASGTRILGPNSLGVIRPKSNLYATFGDKKATPGKIAFISKALRYVAQFLTGRRKPRLDLAL